MRKLARKLAAVAGLTVALTAAAVPAAHAEPEPGCVGVPEWGGIYYYCLQDNVFGLIPRVSTVGQTPVGSNVPAICYFVDCTDPQWVGVTVPVALQIIRNPSDTTVFELRYNCYSYYGCYGAPSSSYYTYYRIERLGYSSYCRFYTNDSLLTSLNGTGVPCTY